ncbi:OmpH family outer membrane protein [Cognatishimia activa]|uniref:OmpH family outer membrane protein n=1 Tax=Cognatishimia activa TaxID=1715691 RepID=UPI002231A2C8|nr:OmpH family outer membrane protein [Cognatishimia activa]UZD91940.1 OmpH family outer membrane protein [Cognatishimia activa]
MTSVLKALIITIGMCLMPIVADAQSRSLPASSVLIIDSERLFLESDFGKRVVAEQQAETALLAAEYRRIEAELSQEELALTQKRPDMTPEDFRKVADAFDERVETIRTTQERREVELAAWGEQERQRFIQLLRPVFETVLSERGAVVVMEKRTVFASSSALDVTQIVLEQANLMLGDGAQQTEDSETNEN